MDTLADIRQNMKDDLGLAQKDWLTNDELDTYIRRAVRSIHAEILSMYEDYFLDFEKKELLGGSDTIAYPDMCYANKIRTVVFTDAPVGEKGVYVCKINSFKDITRMTEYDMLMDNPSSYKTRSWIPQSTTEVVDGATVPVRQMKLVPSAIDDDGHVVIWYIRKSISLVNDNDICDIPEFTDYVLALAKKLYYAQDGDANFTIAKSESDEQQRLMHRTLSNMKLDENDELRQDDDFYSHSMA